LKTVNIDSDYIHDVYKHYKASDLVSHPAIIYLPYSVMSIKLIEIYSLAIPLFMPSPNFFINNGGLGNDRTSTSQPYCDENVHPDIEEKMRPGLNISPHIYSPNLEFAEDPEAEMYWLQYSDFFDWPYIQHFDSYEHLKEILIEADLDLIHKHMMEELEFRKLKVEQSWCDISSRILH